MMSAGGLSGAIGFANLLNSAGGDRLPSDLFDGRENEKVGVGATFVVRTVFPGLGNVGIVKRDVVLCSLQSCDFRDEVNDGLLSSREEYLPSNCTIGSVGELRVSEARSVVGRKFRSGANVDVLGGRGSDR
jgi:hypothetical protein